MIAWSNIGLSSRRGSCLTTRLSVKFDRKYGKLKTNSREVKYQLFYWGRIWLARESGEKKHEILNFLIRISPLCTLWIKTVKFSGEIFLACLARSDLCWLGSFGSNSASHGRGNCDFGRRQKYFVQRLLGINQTESQSKISPSPGFIISFEWRRDPKCGFQCGFEMKRTEDTCYPFQFWVHVKISGDIKTYWI